MENSKLLVEKNIKEVIKKLKNEIPEDKKIICDWHSSYADISVVEEKEGINYIYFSANIYDDGVYSIGNTSYNYDYILDDYFTNVENLIDYHEFKELLDLDKNFNFFDKDDDEIDYYFGLEREFELRLEREAVELTAHKEGITYSLHRDPKGEDWNLTVLVENQPASDTRGNYRDCFDELRREVIYADLFIELTRQGKMVNINNTNENGFKEGLWVIPKEDECIKEEICFFENDKLNGKFAEIYKNNEIAEIGTYKEGIREGKAFSYYDETLNLEEEKVYKNGVLDGKYKNFLYTGELSCEGNLKNGKFEGTLKSYHSTKEGNLFLWQKMEFKDGLANGPVVNYFPNGEIQKRFNMKDDKLNGENIEYYENGIIKKLQKYKDNKLDGLYQEYDSKGVLEKVCNYKDDKLEGNYKEYYNGRLFSDRNYQNDMLNGEAKEYLLNTDGTSSYSEGHYVNDEKQGLWTEYDKEGILHSTQYYVDGREDGTYKQYTKEGILEYTEEWEYGEQLNAIDYYPNGEILGVEQWENGVKNGIAESFYETGELKEKCNFKDNELDGPYFSYDKSGNVIEHEIYSNGELVKNVLKEREETISSEKTNPWAEKLKKDKDNELER